MTESRIADGHGLDRWRYSDCAFERAEAITGSGEAGMGPRAGLRRASKRPTLVSITVSRWRSTMAEIGMVIMVDDDDRTDIQEVAKSLEAKGLHVKQTIPRFGTILGTSDSGLVGTFKSVAGVETVRPQAVFNLPEMDEKVPQ